MMLTRIFHEQSAWKNIIRIEFYVEQELIRPLALFNFESFVRITIMFLVLYIFFWRELLFQQWLKLRQWSYIDGKVCEFDKGNDY